MQVTDRDLAILGLVAEHRLLHSRHLARLVPGSEQQLIRRLQLLFQHGYLDRPLIQRTRRFSAAGDAPMVYALSNKGAALLPRYAEERPDQWRWKNSDLTRGFFDHTLLLADVAVAFRAGCQDHGKARLLSFGEILATRARAEIRAQESAHRWRVTVTSMNSPLVKQGTEIGIAPDGIFGVEDAAGASFFFLEADRGTMPIVRGGRAKAARGSLKQTSLFKKFVAYHETHRSKLHTQRFGIKNFRVLTVTTGGRDRVAAMVDAAAHLTGARGFLLFTTAEELRTTNPLTLEWTNGNGERVRL